MRLDGYKRALGKHGLEWQPELMVQGNFKREDGRKGMLTFLDLPKPLTSMITSNNLEGSGTLAASRTLRLLVLEFLLLACSDDLELISQVYPLLAVALRPVRAMSDVAAISFIEVSWLRRAALGSENANDSAQAEFRKESLVFCTFLKLVI